MDPTLLHERWAQSTQHLADTTATLRRHAQTERLARRAQLAAEHRVQDVAFVLFCWRCPDTSAALAYASSAAARRGPAAGVVTAEALGARYLACPMAALVAIMAAEGPLPRPCFAAARRFLHDTELLDWVQDQNVHRGVAPTSQLLLRHLRVRAACESGQVTTELPRPRPLPSTKWIQRWRKRFGARLGKLPVRERLPVEVARCKAGVANSAFVSLCFSRPEPPRGKTLGPPCGPNLGAPPLCGNTNWGHQAAPTFLSRADKSPELGEALAVWQWWNCYEAHVPIGKKPLRLNMDETAVRYHMPPGRGLISSAAASSLSPRVVQHASRMQQRACLTHVAFVCDQPAIQPLLPQIVLGNEHVLRAQEAAEVQAHLSRNVFVMRRKSAWVDVEIMKSIVRALRCVLAPLSDAWQPILLLDAYGPHMSPAVLRTAATCGIWIVLIPARLTWLLQPCDTHVFLRYKHFLRRRYQELMSDHPEGHLAPAAILLAINEACLRVLQGRSWEHAFLFNGFERGQEHVRASILRELQLDTPPRVPDDLPSLSQLRAVFPSQKSIPLTELFACFTPAPRGRARRVASPPRLSPSPSAERSWSQRLRARGTRTPEAAAAVGSAAASSSSAPPPAGAPPADPPWLSQILPRRSRTPPRGVRLPGLRRPRR